MKRLLSVRSFPTEVIVFGLGALAFGINALRPDAGVSQITNEKVIVAPSAEYLRRSPLSIFGDEIAAEENASDVDRWIRGEVLYREALRLCLDQDDIIIRRRLIQKMEYVLDGMAVPANMSSENIAAYFNAHRERYKRTASESFTQVFFNTNKGEDQAMRRAVSALKQLSHSGRQINQRQSGDPYPDGNRFWEISEDKLIQTFGADFVSNIENLPFKQWAGPLRSRHGIHLVYREKHEPPHVPELKDVYRLVARDLIEESRQTTRAKHYAQLEARYVIQRPASLESSTQAETATLKIPGFHDARKVDLGRIP